MVFPLSLYRDDKEIAELLKKRRFESLHFIDMSRFFGSLDDTYLEFTSCVRELLETVQDNSNYIRDYLDKPHTFLYKKLSSEDLKKVQAEIKEELAKTESFAASLAKLLSHLRNHDFYDKKENSAMDDKTSFLDVYNSDDNLNNPYGEKHSLNPDNMSFVNAIKKAAYFYGQKLLDRIKNNCPFIYHTLSLNYKCYEIVIIVAKLPDFLYQGFLEALDKKMSEMWPLSQLKFEVGTLILDNSLRFPQCNHGPRLYLEHLDDSEIRHIEELYPKKTKIFLINPTKQSMLAFKSKDPPGLFLILSDQDGTRFFQCQNGVYQEVSAQQALTI
jgi:hypothetical protein